MILFPTYEYARTHCSSEIMCSFFNCLTGLHMYTTAQGLCLDAVCHGTLQTLTRVVTRWTDGYVLYWTFTKCMFSMRKSQTVRSDLYNGRVHQPDWKRLYILKNVVKDVIFWLTLTLEASYRSQTELYLCAVLSIWIHTKTNFRVRYCWRHSLPVRWQKYGRCFQQNQDWIAVVLMFQISPSLWLTVHHQLEPFLMSNRREYLYWSYGHNRTGRHRQQQENLFTARDISYLRTFKSQWKCLCGIGCASE